MTKEKLTQMVAQLPDNFSLEEVLDRIVLLSKIEKGIEQSVNDQTFTTQEAREKLNKWLK